MSNQTNLSASAKAERKAAFALGSNLGESLSTLENSLEALAQTPGITLISHSFPV